MNQKSYFAKFCHFWAPGSHFEFCRQCGVAGSERVPLTPLGWYLLKNIDSSFWHGKPQDIVLRAHTWVNTRIARLREGKTKVRDTPTISKSLDLDFSQIKKSKIFTNPSCKFLTASLSWIFCIPTTKQGFNKALGEHLQVLCSQSGLDNLLVSGGHPSYIRSSLQCYVRKNDCVCNSGNCLISAAVPGLG